MHRLIMEVYFDEVLGQNSFRLRKLSCESIVVVHNQRKVDLKILKERITS